MMEGLAGPIMSLLMKMLRSCTPWLCVIGDLRSLASEVGRSFGAVTNILCMSKAKIEVGKYSIASNPYLEPCGTQYGSNEGVNEFLKRPYILSAWS